MRLPVPASRRGINLCLVGHHDLPRLYGLGLGKREGEDPLLHFRGDPGGIDRRIDFERASIIDGASLTVELSAGAFVARTAAEDDQFAVLDPPGCLADRMPARE